jgi:cobyrinic acid a,c-diamide synthase
MSGIVIAGTHSGCGKTTVVLGLLAALGKKGLAVQSFKAGPDFIDSGLHRLITGRPSRNLDLWMCGEDYVKNCYGKISADADISVIEGVMGLYDGRLSTASLAAALDLPVVLVIDAYGMAESAGAVVQGFVDFSDSPLEKGPACPVGRDSGGCQAAVEGDSKKQPPLPPLLRGNLSAAPPRHRIVGVIFNRVASENHYRRLQQSVRDIPVLGYLPRDLDFEIPHRHLGLTVAEENPIAEDNIEKLADAVLKYMDVDMVLKISRGRADSLLGKSLPTPAYRTGRSLCQPEVGALSKGGFPLIKGGQGVVIPSLAKRGEGGFPEKKSALPRSPVIAVAYDRAFCFYYEDNFDLLREAGAEIVFFSPLSDTAIPEKADGIYIGGGYPELHAEQLSRNSSMLTALRSWAEADRPMYAECGGLMYLSRGVHDFEGNFFKMSGVFPFETEMKKGRAHLGYRKVSLKANCILGRAGESMRGHEFHYSAIRNHPPFGENTLQYTVKDSSGNVLPEEGYRTKNTVASYIHIHFGSNPAAGRNFINFITGER